MKDLIDWEDYSEVQKEVKRFDMRVGYTFYDFASVEVNEDYVGEWVRHSDYERLLAAYDKLVFKILENME